MWFDCRISTTHIISFFRFRCSIWLSDLPDLPSTLEKLWCQSNEIKRKSHHTLKDMNRFACAVSVRRTSYLLLISQSSPISLPLWRSCVAKTTRSNVSRSQTRYVNWLAVFACVVSIRQPKHSKVQGILLTFIPLCLQWTAQRKPPFRSRLPNAKSVGEWRDGAWWQQRY